MPGFARSCRSLAEARFSAGPAGRPTGSSILSNIVRLKNQPESAARVSLRRDVNGFMSANDRTSQSVAPEDIRVDDFVCLMRVVREWVPLFDDDSWRRNPLRRAEQLPDDEQLPMRIVEVCLPFVMVKQTDGTHRMLDVRRHRLARVSDAFGRAVFDRMKRQRRRGLHADDSASTE